MTKRLSGKTALITGAAKGIGAVIARAYAAEGARVIVNYHESGAQASALCAQIVADGGEAHAVQGDITDPESVALLMWTTIDRLGGLDILVNNAAAYRYEANLEVTRETFRAQYEVNVLGTLLMVQAATPHLPKGGRIINLSSISATVVSPGISIYAGTKAALNATTRTLAMELGPRGITVNAIAPGSTATDSNEWLTDEKKKSISAKTALGRVGTGEDVARAAVFLASRDAEFITGQILTVDGGFFG